MGSMAKGRAHLLISGRVQGVFFRESARREAFARGVTGWISNRSDGRVEAILEGETPDVQRVVDWCHRGPSRAYVEDVQVEWHPFTGEFGGFAIRSEW
jgi:acylphosphatase